MSNANSGSQISAHDPAHDVIVVGRGNAALCAALMAAEAGARVTLLEAAPRAWRGGNSSHTRNLRCMHDAQQDVLVEAYPEEEFWQDLLRVTGGPSPARRLPEQYYGQFVIIKKVEQKILASWGDDGVVDKSITKTKVLGRVEHEMLQPGFREFFLEEQLLRKHCVSMSFGYDEFKAQLEKMYKVTYIKKNMLARTNGPAMTVNTMHISFKNELFDGNTLSVEEDTAG